MSKSIAFLLLVFVTMFHYACNSQTEPKDATAQVELKKMISEVLSFEEYKKRISTSDVQLVDVRTPEEVAEGKIMHAVNVDYKGTDFKSKIQAFDKAQPIYIYCRSGNRSGKSAVIMQASGFQEIYDLKGGYIAWSKSNNN